MAGWILELSDSNDGPVDVVVDDDDQGEYWESTLPLAYGRRAGALHHSLVVWVTGQLS